MNKKKPKTVAFYTPNGTPVVEEEETENAAMYNDANPKEQTQKTTTTTAPPKTRMKYGLTKPKG